MAPPLPERVYDAPLLVGRRPGGQVVVFGPDGHRIALSPEAARQSLAALERTLDLPADAAARPPAVTRLVPGAVRRPLRRRVQQFARAWHDACHGRGVGLRGIVACVLAPVAFAVVAGAALLLLLLGFSQATVLAWWPVALVSGLVIAPIAAYRVAPVLMDAEERRPPWRPGARPVLVASND